MLELRDLKRSRWLVSVGYQMTLRIVEIGSVLCVVDPRGVESATACGVKGASPRTSVPTPSRPAPPSAAPRPARQHSALDVRAIRTPVSLPIATDAPRARG